MMRRRRWSTAAVLAVLTLGLLGTVPAAAGGKPVTLGYVMGTDLYDGYVPADIPVGQYSYLAYAFTRPTAGGRCAMGDPWSDYQRPFPAGQSVDGVADKASDPAPRLFGYLGQLRKLKADRLRR